MEGPKIHLSATELELATNAEIILTKNRIIQKTIALFESIQNHITDPIKTGALPEVFSRVGPKISNGENYRGLPYVVLDYPRLANQGNLCFIRTMFWWGHFFSSTLQLSGVYKEQALEQVRFFYQNLARENYYIGIHTDPWQHHFEESNYRPIGLLSPKAFAAVLQEQPHIKIAAKWPLEQWDSAAISLTNSWKLLAGLIA